MICQEEMVPDLLVQLVWAADAQPGLAAAQLVLTEPAIARPAEPGSHICVASPVRQ